MSSDRTFAPLKIANQTETRRGWDTVMTSLPELARWIARAMAVDITEFVQDEYTYVGATEPEGDDAGKLWLKTSSPPGIGIPFGSGYEVIYPYPPNCAVLWTAGDDLLPAYMRKLTDVELANYSLTDPDSEEVYWVILEES